MSHKHIFCSEPRHENPNSRYETIQTHQNHVKLDEEINYVEKAVKKLYASKCLARLLDGSCSTEYWNYSVGQSKQTHQGVYSRSPEPNRVVPLYNAGHKQKSEPENEVRDSTRATAQS